VFSREEGMLTAFGNQPPIILPGTLDPTPRATQREIVTGRKDVVACNECCQRRDISGRDESVPLITSR
jgi:hypothetical protein